MAAIRQNVAGLGAADRVKIGASTVAAARPDHPFHLLFADPPYAGGSGTSALRLILENGWAAEKAWICIETERGHSVDPIGCSLELERDVGRARLTLLRS